MFNDEMKNILFETINKICLKNYKIKYVIVNSDMHYAKDYYSTTKNYLYKKNIKADIKYLEDNQLFFQSDNNLNIIFLCEGNNEYSLKSFKIYHKTLTVL